MKLSNQQIDALALELRNNLIKPIREFNAKIYESEEYINFEKENEDCKTLEAIRIKNNIDTSYQWTQMYGILKDTAFKSKLKTYDAMSYDIIRREIILSTIDSSDLESLISKVSAKFQ